MADSSILYQSQWFSIRADAQGTEYVASSGDEVLVIPLDSDNRVIFIQEPAPAFDDMALIVPTGETSPSRTYAETANLELQEEIGYCAKELVSLGELRPWSKYLNVRTFVYLAQKLTPSVLEGDEDYEIETEPIPLDQFETLIANSRLTDARVISALFLTRQHLAGNGQNR